MSTKWTPLQASLNVAHCPPEQLMATLLPYFWQYECELEAGVHYRTNRSGYRVKHLGKDRRVRYLRVRDIHYYWDTDGDVFRTPELALFAIGKSEPPGNIMAELTYGKNPATYPWWVAEQERRRGEPLPYSHGDVGLNQQASDLVDQIISKLMMMVPSDNGTAEMAAEIAQNFAAQKPVLHKMVSKVLEKVCLDCGQVGPGRQHSPGPTAPDFIPPFVPAGG